MSSETGSIQFKWRISFINNFASKINDTENPQKVQYSRSVFEYDAKHCRLFCEAWRCDKELVGDTVPPNA